MFISRPIVNPHVRSIPAIEGGTRHPTARFRHGRPGLLGGALIADADPPLGCRMRAAGRTSCTFAPTAKPTMQRSTCSGTVSVPGSTRD